jgi:hypothetical protein
MENLILSVLPKGPLAIPIVALAVIFYVYPTVRQLWYEHRDRAREQSRLKQQLEILKLRYEIEALKRSHNLDPFPDDPGPTVGEPQRRSEPIKPSPLTKSRRRKLFLISAAGALTILVPYSVNVYMVARIDFFSVISLWAVCSILIFCCLAGLAGIKLGNNSLPRAFLIGAFLPFLFYGLMVIVFKVFV